MSSAYWPLPAGDGFDKKRYGGVAVEPRADNSFRFVRADRIAGIGLSLLTSPDGHFVLDEDGNIIIDERHVYRPIGFSDGGRVIVCEQYAKTLSPLIGWREGFSAG